MDYTQKRRTQAQRYAESFMRDIIDGKIQINQLDSKGRSFLHNEQSMIAWYPEILDWMIEQGADVNLKDKQGKTPLHVWYSMENVALILIVHGADVNAQDKNGNTPFHRGIGLTEKIVNQLIRAGADFTIKNNDGISRYDNILRRAKGIDPEDCLCRQYQAIAAHIREYVLSVNGGDE